MKLARELVAAFLFFVPCEIAAYGAGTAGRNGVAQFYWEFALLEWIIYVILFRGSWTNLAMGAYDLVVFVVVTTAWLPWMIIIDRSSDPGARLVGAFIFGWRAYIPQLALSLAVANLIRNVIFARERKGDSMPASA
ncbi:MAG TPA: hypothetical protein VHD32_09290 [Candidatus Didemnitutus sp.]|nr:hypothetical protein [Candidatus Didemnitutus sp.]